MFRIPELILDKEFEDLVLNDVDCKRIEIPFLYKKYRRDRYNDRIPCEACNDSLNSAVEGSLDCPYCLGAGYSFDQGIGTGWFSHPLFFTTNGLDIRNLAGDTAQNKVNLYTDKKLVFHDRDVILIPTLDDDGNIVKPLISLGIYSIYEDWLYRSHAVLTEYNRYKLSTTKDKSFERLMRDE